jgi:predicted ATP-grasp superfamily ATP-dependent carboligase
MDPELRRTVARAASAPLAPALVLDVGWVNGLAAIRTLGRAGVPVLALDHRISPLGFRSRYAIPVRCPDPFADREGFVEFLAELGDLLGRPAPVFPTHDPYVNAVAWGAERLGGRFLCPFASWDVLEGLQSKRRQLEVARTAGVDVPEARSPDSAEDARRAAKEIGPPVLVKPSDPVGFKARFGSQAFRCETAAEAEEAWVRAEEFAPTVQEWVPGGDEELYSLGSYVSADGEALGLFCGRKLRQTPKGIGTCRVSEAVWVDEVVDAGLRLQRAFGYHGLAQVEFKRDPRNGRFKLMEINPRIWQWHGLAAACGVDLVWIAYEDLTGTPPPAARTDGARKRWAITLLPGERPALVRPPYVEAVLARDDLKPAAAHLVRVVRGTWRQARTDSGRR